MDKELSVSASYDPQERSYEYLEYMDSFCGNDEYYLRVPAGEIVVSIPDFDIVRYEGVFIDFTKDEDKNSVDICRVAAAYSALEYDGMSEFSHSKLSKIDSSLSESYIVDKFDEFSAIIDAVFDDEKKCAELFAETGNIIHIASLNYDYSLQYFCGEPQSGKTVEFISLIAEAK